MSTTSWQVTVASTALIWAALSWWLTRRRDLAWRRTEFLVRQSEHLDNDAEMRECTLLLYGKHATLTLNDMLDNAEREQATTSEQQRLTVQFEKYLNFFWRIAYAHLVLHTLTRDDLWAFGAYFTRIAKHERLRAYCLRVGYAEIVRVTDSLHQ